MIFRKIWGCLSVLLDHRKRFLLLESTQPRSENLLWFHSASAGEWESLRPIAQAWLRAGGTVGLSFFSSSAEKFAESFLGALSQDETSQVVYCGSSPKEQGWLKLLSRFQPQACLTNRYEAWPSLWAALSELRLPLVLVNAEPRPSLVWVRRALSLFRVDLPKLIFFAIHEDAQERLKQLFPGAELRLAGDPRLERMEERLKTQNSRAQTIKEDLKAWRGSKKLLLVGNAWAVDLEALSPLFSRSDLCVLVVPHNLEQSNLAVLQGLIHGHPSVRLLAEYGVLAELYSFADIAYVGGGFGKGIHSVIEPAAHAIPIVAGSHRAEYFSETVWLRAIGQLQLAEKLNDVAPMIQKLIEGTVPNREMFQLAWKEKLGATEVILERIRSLL
jgi:3-deoxy-D-manno-octulosonic-acid transferase